MSALERRCLRKDKSMDGPRHGERVGSEDFRSIIAGFNAPTSPYPSEKLIHQLFEEQVRRTPHVTALACRNQSVTFAELNARANQLARQLRAHGVGRERRVGVCAEPGLDAMVAMLGTLKANGACVPLDPGYSSEC